VDADVTPHGLNWLDPVVDRCRDLIASHTQVRQWTKLSTQGGSSELVTEVDLAVEALLVEAVHERLPHAAILSEESSPEVSALAADTCVVIDPIDGTDELVAGRPGYAISVALVQSGQPAAALLDMPAHRRRFHGVSGGGTALNGKPVVLSEAENLSQARLAVSATQRRNEWLQEFWDTVDAGAIVPTPAFAAKLAAVLAGDCDAALYLSIDPHPTAVWDYAAPAFLLAEAGGWFGSLGGVDLFQQRPFTYTGGWIAAPAAMRDPLLAIASGAPRP
jgi:myo-inositol-1(or 4)-monophosphatase